MAINKQFKVPVNLLNAPTDPIIGHEGDIYYNTTTNVIRLYKNGAWEDILASSTVEGSPGYYGAFHDTTTQNIVSTTTAYKITMNSTDESNGISRDVADTSKIRFAHAGTYSLTFSIQLINTSNSIQNANVWFKKGNGSGSSSDIPYSNSQTTVPNRHGGLEGQSILTVNFVATFAADDYVQLYWQGESTALSIETIAAGTTPTTPVTPSIIFTAVQVASVLTGGGGGASVLDDLTDVVQTDPADNEVLAYNSANNTWINQTAVEAGLQAIVSGVTDTEIGYLDGVTSSIQTQIDGKISASSSDTLTNKIINLGTGITSIAAYDNISGFYGQNNIVILQSGIDRGGRINITSEGVITIANSGIGYTNGIVTTTGGTRLIITVGGNVITGTLAEFNAALTDADFATTGTTLSHYGITDAIDTSATSQTKTGDLTITGNLTVNGTTTTINSTAVNVNNQVIFEGATANAFETTLSAVDPTADRTINLPDASGTLVLTDSPTFTGSVSVGTDIGSSGSELAITNDTKTSIKTLNNSVVVTQSTGITLNSGGVGTAKTWIFKNNGDLTFPDSSNQSTAFLGMSSYSTTNLSEGTNLYFTNERAVSALSSTLSSYLTTSSASSTYLTQSSASSTYQPLDQDLTDIAALTGNGIIRRTSGTWGMDNNTYLTSGDVSGTYATISSLSSYLTTATAATTYQPIGDYLTSETDPVFVASEAYNITSTDTSNWDTAYGWGDHSSAGYLTSSSLSGYATETYVSTGYQIKDQDLTDISALTGDGLLSRQSGVWSMDTTSYATTGDISSAVGDYIPLTQKGQDQGVAELDIDGFVPVTQLPDLSATYSVTSHNHTLDSLSNVVITGTPTDGQAIVWDTTTSKWVNETVSGGGASYPDQTGNTGKFLQTNGSTVSWADETDPIFAASEAYNIISLDISNWNTAYGWGDHSGLYLTSETDPVFSASEAYNITSTDTSNWDTAYGWGDHALAGYLTSYSEISTLEDVTDRGATTTSSITISNINDSTSPTSGALIVSGGVGIAKDVWIDGNLHVNGTTETLHTHTISTSDNLIYLNAAHDSTITNAVGDGTYVTYTADNDYTPGMDIRVTGMNPSGYNISSADGLIVYSATPIQFVVAKNTTGSFVSGGTAHAKVEANADLGFAGGYYNAGYAHAGLFRDASDGIFKFFDGYTPEPDEAVNIDTGHASFSFAPIKVEVLDVVDASTTRTNLGLTIGMNVQAWNSNLAAVADGTYIGDDSITTVGTISDGTWNGNTINYSYGGTGLTTLGTAGQVLKVNSGATGLEWGTVDLSLYAPKASPTFTGTATIGEAVVKSTSTTITSSSATTIASIPVGLGMVLAECVVLLSSTSDGSYYTSKILVRGDASTADLTEYAIIQDGSMNVTFTVVPGSNVLLKVATTNAGVKAKIISTYISAENGAA